MNLYANYKEFIKGKKEIWILLKTKLDMNIKSEGAGQVRHQLIYATH